VQQRELVEVLGEAGRQHHDDREDHGGGTDHRGADEHRLGGGLERVAGAVVLLQQRLGVLELHVEAVLAADLRGHVRNRLR